MPSSSKFRSRSSSQELQPEQKPIDPGFLKALMSTEFWERDIWPRAKSALVGVPANAVGAAVDIGLLMHDIRTWGTPLEGVRPENVNIPLSSDWLGSRAGADPDSAAFIASGFVSPDLTDFNKAVLAGSKLFDTALIGGVAAWAKPSRLGEAEELLKRGATQEEIYTKTGWLKDLDDKWKFWIDDRGAKFNDDLINNIEKGKVVRPQFDKNGMGVITYKMEDILDHQELYANYPVARDLPVRFHVKRNYSGSGLSITSPDNSRALAQFTPGIGDRPEMLEIFSGGDDKQSLHSLILHEIQHWIQDFEGFARGGQPQTFNDVFEISLIDDMLLAADDGRVFTDRLDIAEFTKELTGVNPNKELLDNLDRMFFQIQNDDTGELWSVFKSYSKTLVHNASAMLDQLHVYGRSPKEILNMAQDGRLDRWGFEWYRRLAGEVEARTVQEALITVDEDFFTRKSWKRLAREIGEVGESDQIVKQ